MKTTAETIFSMPWPKTTLPFAIINQVCKGTFHVVYLNEKPHFHSTFGYRTSNGPLRTHSVKSEETTDWKAVVVTYDQWLAAQPPAQPYPQVGETWMTSNGPVKIVYIKTLGLNCPVNWRCCAEHKLGALNIYGLEELKPMPPEVVFTNNVLAKLEEEPVDMNALLVDVAQLISAGKLDAELAALGYVRQY